MSNKFNSIQWLIGVDAIFIFAILLTSFSLAINDTVADDDTKNVPPLFAFCVNSEKRTLDQQNMMLHEIGFTGIGIEYNGTIKKFETEVASAKKNLLKVAMVFLEVDITRDPPFNRDFVKVLPFLKGEGTQLALQIRAGGKPTKPSDLLDEKIVEVIRQIREIVERFEIGVVLYPHIPHSNNRCFYVETVKDAVRLAEKFPDHKVGVMFNLSHWAVNDKSDLETLFMLARPYLVSVTINGVDKPEEVKNKDVRSGNWIQPLDSGSFKIETLFEILKKNDYKGTFGLQCFGISGNTKEHLKRSIKKWQELNGQ
ncbi:MAG: TIM barrel protein [Planctomycetaceae bacterium]|jgi:sugar phosphate isomerase/epimerase|nr:TIM barrel protein [Planctomycetaceae bacterium]